MRTSACWAALLLALVAGPAWAATPEGGGPREPHPREEEKGPSARGHLLLVVDLSPKGTEVRLARRVDLPLKTMRRGTWQVQVLDGAGKRLHVQPLADPSFVRGEFHGPDGTIEAVRHQLEKTAFTLRLPLLEGAAQVRVLAPAAPSLEGEARAGDAAPPELMEVGSFAWPEVR